MAQTTGPLSWAEIIAKQNALIGRCRNAEARAYEFACLQAMRHAAANAARAERGAS